MQVTFVTILHNTVVVNGPVLRKLKGSRAIAKKSKKLQICSCSTVAMSRSRIQVWMGRTSKCWRSH